MIKLVRTAYEKGVTLFDAAESYGPFANEHLVGEALEPIRDRVVISTKFGFDIDLETGQRRGGTNSRPEHVKAVAEACLKRLRADCRDAAASRGHGRGRSAGPCRQRRGCPHALPLSRGRREHALGLDLLAQRCGRQPGRAHGGGGVFGTGTGWPDIIVATIMAALGISGGWQIVRHALDELRTETAAVPAE
jgi:hypothetical protein